MKNVCEACKNAKWKNKNCYCVKYGIPVYQPRMFCVAYDSKNGRKEGESK